MKEMMTFHDTWEEFEKSYGFTDNEEVYTNGARLIPSFRVKQWLDHLPSVQPTQLTDDDKETIRIHLSAIKEGLCNQRRWNEAREYEELINRLLSTLFVIRCKECKHWEIGNTTKNYPNPYICDLHSFMHGFERSALPEDYCSWAELRGDAE